jgi:hypothetical protein
MWGEFGALCNFAEARKLHLSESGPVETGEQPRDMVNRLYRRAIRRERTCPALHELCKRKGYLLSPHAEHGHMPSLSLPIKATVCQLLTGIRETLDAVENDLPNRAFL